jgi:hypothetical protein
MQKHACQPFSLPPLTDDRAIGSSLLLLLLWLEVSGYRFCRTNEH